VICPDLQLVQVNGKAIGYVDRVKFLGLYVDSALSFKYHIRLLKYTLAAIIPLMKRLQYYAPPGWRRIYFSYFHSHLSFMCSIWGNVCHSTLRELQILQNRALKLLFGLDYCTPSVTVYTKTDVLPGCFSFATIVDHGRLWLLVGAFHSQLWSTILNYAKMTSLAWFWWRIKEKASELEHQRGKTALLFIHNFSINNVIKNYCLSSSVLF